MAAPELEAQVAFEMRLLIELYDFLERQIAEAQAQLAGLLDGDTARRSLTIPGGVPGHRGHPPRRNRWRAASPATVPR